MDPTSIVGGLAAAAAYGLAIGTGLRLIPTARRASRDLRQFSRSPDGALERERLLQQSAQTKARRLSGRTRESSIVGLYGEVLRHADGSYTRGYDLPLQPTMLAPDEVADTYIDGFANMLTVDLPAGTVLQFRYAVGPDPGRAVAEHLRARSYEHAYFPAARLHDLNIDFLKAMADTGVFRQEHASLFVRVPMSHENDRSLHGFNTFFASIPIGASTALAVSSIARLNTGPVPGLMALSVAFANMSKKVFARRKSIFGYWRCKVLSA